MKRFLAAGLLCCALAHAQSETNAPASIIAGANSFLSSLDEAQRSKVLFDYNDAAQRVKWSNLPTSMVARAGLKLGDLTDAQRKSAMNLLAATLSKRGYQKVLAIMEGDEVLKTAGGGRGATMFGRDLFYISILGKPSLKDPWMLQFGGHHLALNIAMVGREGILTPTLTAAQPAKYTVDGKTVRPLGAENDKGFALINALDETQRKQAILSYKVADLVLGPGHDGKNNPAGRDQRLRTECQPARHAPGSRRGMVRHRQRAGSRRANGGTQGRHRRHLVRVEWAHHQRLASILSDTGADGGYRIRAATNGRRSHDAHPHDLSRPDERLREEVCGTLITRDASQARSSAYWSR